MLPLLALPTVVYVVALVFAPGRTSLITHIYLVTVAGCSVAVLALGLARSLRPLGPSPFERGLHRSVRPAEGVRQLQQLEREVTLGRQNAWDLHNRLCPTLRETAAGLLVTRRGVDLERQAHDAEQLVGPDAWALVRPDRAVPGHRHAPGVSPAALDRAVAALEAL